MKFNLKSMMQRLTDLYYYSPNSEEYKQALKKARRDVFYALPGMVVVFAEVQAHDYVTGSARSSMTHVLAPEPVNTEYTLGWHDNYTAVLALDNGITAMSDIATLELEQENMWIAGTVEIEPPQGYALVTENGNRHQLKYGDKVRNVTYKE